MTRRLLPLLPLLIFCLLSRGALDTSNAAQPEFQDVFVGGQDGYPAYRIPSLVTTKQGSLLAFAEGRASLRDHAENDIVMKRSTNSGQTWGRLQVIDEDGTNALNNPTAVVVRKSGRVLLLYQRYAKGYGEHNAEPGLDGPHICRTFLTFSDDDGLHWAPHRDITAQVKRPTEVTSTASGPGVGIQLAKGPHAGRILMPFNQGPYGRWQVYAAFSDDDGNSWHYGETAPEGTPGYANEVQFIELNDGSVMLNARNQGGRKCRKIALSKDGGKPGPLPAMIQPWWTQPARAACWRHPGAGESRPGRVSVQTIRRHHPAARMAPFA